MNEVYYVWSIVNGVMEMGEFVNSTVDRNALLASWRCIYGIEPHAYSNGDDSVDLGWERYNRQTAWQVPTSEGG